MDPPIVPGLTKTSGVYNVMFMKANNKFGNLPHDIYGTDKVWVLMNYVLFYARFESGNFEKIKSGLEDNFRFVNFYGMATHQTTVNIIDEPFFPRPKGHMRKIKISFFDQQSKIYTIFEFSLARKTDIKTLEDLALNAVISNVTSHLMINKMEIPETLKMTLRTEFYNEWSRKRFPSYNITLSPFAESLKASGIDARTLDQIMDDYMHRIEMTQRFGYKKIDWEKFVQEIARLHSVSPGPLCHLQKTISILRFVPATQDVDAAEAMDLSPPLPLDLSLVPPRI